MAKAIKSPLDKYFNPHSNKYSFVPINIEAQYNFPEVEKMKKVWIKIFLFLVVMCTFAMAISAILAEVLWN
ncbi:hypothetical protein [Otariodibacter oris]|uniref:hypothetical protein n=1 Tax=Otariodibacter oris TaxID=1032623 RepID=UPI000EB53BC3|nr:hypothetical protein [Otariodibacter oris]QGM80843.1 hypothetical protein A6A10_05215 [Otariodibacter oris]